MPTGDTKPRAGQSQTTPRLAAYLRVSRQGSREEIISPELQLEAVRGMARARGFELVEYPVELDVSGAKVSRRVLDEILEAVEDGELDGVAVAKLDRFSRLAPRDRLELVDRVERAGGTIESAAEPLDNSTPATRWARDSVFGFARMQWEQLAEGWVKSKESAIERGIAITSRRPFGYQFDEEHRLIVDEEEAAIVRELYELRAGGASWDELAVRFEQRTGQKRARTSMSYLCSNRLYLGELRYGALVNLEAVDAIVSTELFETVQNVNARRRVGRGAAVNRARSLLAGIAKCRNCGRGLAWTTAGGGSTYYYRCTGRARECSARASINAEALDAWVIERVLEWAGAAADELVEVELEDVEEERGRLERRLLDAVESLEAYESDVELELEVGREAYAKGRRARVALVERRRQELEELGEATEFETARTTLRQELAGGTASVDERRRLLSVVLEAVSVRRTPYWNAPVEERVELVWRAP